MTAKKAPRAQQPLPRVPNGHSYCWAEYSIGRRCTKPQGHAGGCVDDYAPRIKFKW